MDGFKMAEAKVECTVPIADDLYQTIELMSEETGVPIESIVDAIFRMAFEARNLEEILEDLQNGQKAD